MNSIRNDFPIFTQKVPGRPLIYVDNAATTQKPQAVIDALVSFYTQNNANTGRSIHTLGEQATRLYEGARETVARFINAQDPSEIVFTRGTTESINLVAATWGSEHIASGDEILLSELEHHANLLPWQRLAQQKGALVRFIPILPDGMLDMAQLPHLLTSKTKLVAITQVSNALGTQIDLHTIIQAARMVGAKVLVDAAQSAPHQSIDAQGLDADFLVFSGHKMLGPTGIGVLYINRRLHDQIPPYQLGGGMVYNVDFKHATFLPMPHRLEAGTPSIAQAIGLAAAIEYIQKNIDFTALQRHEANLCARFIEGLSTIDRITILGPIDQLKEKGHLVSFTVQGVHPHDVAAYLDQYGVAVRAGHHCAQPLAKKLGIDASVRASFYAYNTPEEVDECIEVLKKVLHTFFL